MEVEKLLSIAYMAFIFLTKALPQGKFRGIWEQINYLDQRKRNSRKQGSMSSPVSLPSVSILTPYPPHAHNHNTH